MLTSLSLTNFRGFGQLDIPKLARVNLIGGVNNAGKTAILEAIYLLLEDEEAKANMLPGLFRANSKVNDRRYFWRWIARDSAADGTVMVSAEVAGVCQKRVVWKPTPKGLGRASRETDSAGFDAAVRLGDIVPEWPEPLVFSPAPTSPVEDAQVYLKALRLSPAVNEGRIEALLREVDPRLQVIRAFPDEDKNQPLLHVGLGSGKALPATQLGQGFNRLLRIYSALLAAEAKVFLIDEIETGLHHSVLETVWKGLAALARQEDVQIFATTHSREAILAAHRVFSAEPEYDFAYHRLERVDGEIKVVTYDQALLAGADERNFEVR